MAIQAYFETDLEQSLLERVKVALETANNASLQIKNLIENKVTAQQSAKLQSTWAGTSELSHPFLILDQWANALSN